MRLLRLVPANDQFLTEEGRPTKAMFRPSPEDEKHSPVLVSVWDYSVVNAARAQALRADDKLRDGFTVDSKDIAVVSEWAQRQGFPELSVEPDPDGASGKYLTPEEREAHYGIGGLSEQGLSKPQKNLRKEVLQRLAEKAVGPVS